MTRVEEVVAALEVLAPPRLAASWDNTGLLLEGTREVRRILLCVDLTAPVLAEAVGAAADLVVAYHPPVFAGLKRLTSATPQGRVILGALRAGLSVYSPHTALDAAAGGMNDWLLEAFGPLSERAPLEPDRLDPTVGAGRRAALASARPLGELVDAVKRHLGLAQVRLAVDDPLREVRTVAVCPGAGGSLFAPRGGEDLYLTGELRHHDVLALVAAGAAVVLTDHTNTERGYLPRLASRLASALPGVDLVCSAVDRDPLAPA